MQKRGGGIFGFSNGCLCCGLVQRERKRDGNGEGADSLCQRECMPPRLGLVFLCSPLHGGKLEIDRSRLRRNAGGVRFACLEFFSGKKGRRERHESCRCRCRCSYAAAAYVQVRSLFTLGMIGGTALCRTDDKFQNLGSNPHFFQDMRFICVAFKF